MAATVVAVETVEMAAMAPAVDAARAVARAATNVVTRIVNGVVIGTGIAIVIDRVPSGQLAASDPRPARGNRETPVARARTTVGIAIAVDRRGQNSPGNGPRTSKPSSQPLQRSSWRLAPRVGPAQARQGRNSSARSDGGVDAAAAVAAAARVVSSAVRPGRSSRVLIRCPSPLARKTP